MVDPLFAAAAGAVAGAGLTFVADRLRRARVPVAPSQGPDLPGPFEDDGRAQRVLAAFPLAAFLIDARGIVRFANAEAERLFELRAQRAVGQALIAVVPSVALERQVATAIGGERSTRDLAIGEFARERTLGITAHPFEDGAIVVAADRTALLAIERVRREFVANVSHELRTPLTTIKLMLETVLLAGDEPEARDLFLPQIVSEVDRMTRLVADLLDSARSESGNLKLARDVFDVREIAASVAATFAQRMASAGVELSLLADREVFVDADRNRLTQVALNLLDNALRHTPAGGSVTIEVTSEGEHALLRVRDTGSGIPYHDLPHVFERFYVVDRSRSREHAGTGIGLSIARQIVEAHGGTIDAESVYGRGAAFTCRLPQIGEVGTASPMLEH